MDSRIFLAIIIIALFLRCTNLTTKQLGVDEAVTIQQTQSDFPTLINNLRFHDAHPPLYPITAWSIYQIRHEIVDVQFLSILLGIGTLFLTYAIFKELFDAKIATYALILMIFNPLAIAYSQQMRMYGLFAFLFLGLIYLLIKSEKNPSKKLWAGIIILNIALLLTHYHGFIVMGCEFLYFLFSPSKKNALIPIISTALILPIILFFLLPSLSYVGEHTYTQRGVSDFGYVLYKFVAGINIGNAGLSLTGIQGFLLVGIALAMIYGGMFFGLRDLQKPAFKVFLFFFVILMLVTFAIAQIFPVFFYFRYFFYILPLMFIPLVNFLKKGTDSDVTMFICIIIICWLAVFTRYIEIILSPEWNAVFGI